MRLDSFIEAWCNRTTDCTTLVYSFHLFSLGTLSSWETSCVYVNASVVPVCM